jgi:hypothetical protein
MFRGIFESLDCGFAVRDVLAVSPLSASAQTPLCYELLSGSESVPPRGSGWVIDGQPSRREDLVLASDLIAGANPPATARWY